MTSQSNVAELIPFVENIANRVRRVYGNEVSHSDLVSYGMLGLLDARERYLEDIDCKFERYAYYRVFGAMMDGTRRWTVRRELARLRRRTEDRAGDAAAESEAPRRTTSVPALARTPDRPPEGVASFSGLRRELCERSPESELNLGTLATALTEVLDSLDAKERRIVDLYYFNDHSFRDVAALIGCSPSWLCRVHQGILDKLRRHLGRRGVAWGGQVSDGSGTRPHPHGSSRTPRGRSAR